jgi:hypothetical protein
MNLTLTEMMGIFYSFKKEHGGSAPSKFFVSQKTWREFCYSEDANRFTVFGYCREVTKNEFMGVPVYQVIEDGIFECH